MSPLEPFALSPFDTTQIFISLPTVDSNLYGIYEFEAKQRIAVRDIDDWPIVAVSLMLDCPIWTEDADFFGAGVATWTSDRVHLYLSKGNLT